MANISTELVENIIYPLIILFLSIAFIKEIPKMESDPIKKKYWFMYRGTVVLQVFAFSITFHTSICKLRVITGDHKFGAYYCVTISFAVLVLLLGTIFSYSGKLAFCQLAAGQYVDRSLFPGYERVLRGLFLTKYYWALWVTLLLTVSLYLLGKEL